MSRRKKRTRSDQIFKVYAAISLLVAASLSLPFSFNDKGFNYKPFLIIFFITLIVLNVLGIIFSLPVVKGKIGERKIRKLLEKFTKYQDVYVINDVIVPGDNNQTSQIDHILFSKGGIFVIETKNYSGRIYGNDSQREWTQVLAYGRTKNKFYSPVKQNQTHVYRLKDILGNKYSFISCIVFLKANISYLESDFVFTPRELKKYLKKTIKEECISSNDILDAYNKVKEYKDNPLKNTKEHVKEIKQTLKNIDNLICPRCGGQLLLRHGNGGTMFYGCSNYPKCKFTKKK